MIPLTRLKRDVQFNNELTQVVDVLKGISAARFHLLEKQLALFEAYFTAAADILSLIHFPALQHPFARAQTPRVGVILVTSNAGFLGGLNSQVVSAGLREAGADGLMTVVGERGVGYVHDLRRDCTAFPGIEEASQLSLAMAVREHVVRQVLEGDCGRVAIAYPKPVSFAIQEVVVETLLPCSAWAPKPNAHIADAEILWESSHEEIMEYVVVQWVGHRLDEIFALSRLAELAARVVHLEGSYQELVKRGKKLRLQYFHARHEIIDRSMREIFAAKLLHGNADAQ